MRTEYQIQTGPVILVPVGWTWDEEEGAYQQCFRCTAKVFAKDNPWHIEVGTGEYLTTEVRPVHIECLETGDHIVEVLDQFIRCGHEHLQCRECDAVSINAQVEHIGLGKEDLKEGLRQAPDTIQPSQPTAAGVIDLDDIPF